MNENRDYYDVESKWVRSVNMAKQGIPMALYLRTKATEVFPALKVKVCGEEYERQSETEIPAESESLRAKQEMLLKRFGTSV